MPILDGVETTQIIRENEKSTSKHIPIIALTAHAMKGDRERFLKAGMDEYVSKPIRVEDLFIALEKVKNLQRAHAASLSDLEESA